VSRIESQLTLKKEFTKEELSEMREGYFDELSRLKDLESELAYAKEDLGGKIKAVKARVDELYDRISRKYTFEKVLCEKRFDEENHLIVWVDTHTGEIVKSEKAPPDLFSPEQIPLEAGDRRITDPDDVDEDNTTDVDEEEYDDDDLPLDDDDSYVDDED